MALIKANQRFFDVQHEPLQTLPPIGGYEDMPLLSLKMSVENLETIVSKVTQNAHVATERSAYPDNGLTQDQSAAICLYTMNSKSNDQSLCTRLNDALRSKDRSELIPYLFYLKLFLSALWKLKSVRKTVWRGVKADLSSEYPCGKTVIWWGFSSCVASFDEIQSDKFVGKTGTRTLFEIECETGKAINAHSHYHDINEVLLLPSIQLKVIDQIHSADGLCLIRLKEVKSSYSFMKSPLSSSTINTSTKRTEQKANSAPSFSFLRGTTDFLDAKRSKSFYSPPSSSSSSSSSSSPNISKRQTNIVKKPTKPYENKPLKELIKQERKNQSIRFSKQFFNYDDMEIITDELISNQSWTIMSLWENGMNDRHMTILMRGLKTNSTVMCLSLDRNLLGDDGASILASALKTNTYLRSIYLNDNRISDEGAEELSQMLFVNRTLTHLELSSNTIGDHGVAALSNALKVNKYLRTFCLNDNKISKVGAEYVSEMLSMNKTLTDLQLSSNAIGDDGVISIVHALEHNNNTLESLHIGETMISVNSMHNIEQMLKMNSMLKCLYLNNNHLGDDALIMIISALIQNTTLTTLDLSMNDLTEKSANKLACLLKQTETGLTTLIISDNPLGDRGIASIASALINNRSLVKLMVECVEMTNEGLRELTIMLSLNKELRYLALNGNQIDDNGMKLISDALECNRSLEYLYLNNCDLKDECVPLIIEMMKHSKTLTSIEMVKNRLTEHGKRKIKEAKTRDTTCTVYLDFTFH